MDAEQPQNNEGDVPSGDMPSQDAPDTSNQNVVTLPPDMLPPGLTPKDGDKITFCVQGMDENGVKGYFEAPAAPEEDWESGFKKSMSARDDGNDGQPM